MANNFHYDGFSTPNHTSVPDDVFDVLAPVLSEAELRVLLYIVRRTFGFKKERDSISLSQMVEGIRTKDGRVIDRGTGMSRRGVMKGCAGLIEKGVITVEKRRSEQGDNDVNIYSLRFKDQRVGNNVPHGRERHAPPVGNNVPPQNTGLQETVLQDSNRKFGTRKKTAGETEHQQPERVEKPPRSSSGTFEPISAALSRYQAAASIKPPPDDERSLLGALLAPYRSEFGDQASKRASTSRILKLFIQKGVAQAAFANLLAEAASRTRESMRLGVIETRAFAYYIRVLENLLQPG